MFQTQVRDQLTGNPGVRMFADSEGGTGLRRYLYKRPVRVTRMGALDLCLQRITTICLNCSAHQTKSMYSMADTAHGVILTLFQLSYTRHTNGVVAE